LGSTVSGTVTPAESFKSELLFIVAEEAREQGKRGEKKDFLRSHELKQNEMDAAYYAKQERQT
jgi:hypothetical protein